MKRAKAFVMSGKLVEDSMVKGSFVESYPTIVRLMVCEEKLREIWETIPEEISGLWIRVSRKRTKNAVPIWFERSYEWVSWGLRKYDWYSLYSYSQERLLSLFTKEIQVLRLWVTVWYEEK